MAGRRCGRSPRPRPWRARRRSAGSASRVHHDAEEAELGAPEGGPRAADERHRGHGVHPGRRAQPAGALDRRDPRRPREGPAGRALPHRPRHRSTPPGSRTAGRADPSTARRRPRATAPRRQELDDAATGHHSSAARSTPDPQVREPAGGEVHQRHDARGQEEPLRGHHVRRARPAWPSAPSRTRSSCSSRPWTT